MSRRAAIKTCLLSATMFTSALAVPTTLRAEDAPATAADEGGDTIVVTGTRRSTTIMETPINISAIGAEELARQRINDVRGLADFTPGMTVSDTGPGATGSIVLRGLSASDVSSGGSNYDNAMGIYLGEVPLYYDFKLLDISRVETLLGPQGTLYGLGTLAGAIRYIPNRPNVDAFEGEVHGRVYGKSHSGQVGYQADGVINIPIVPGHIAFRSSTGYYYDPGFIDYPLLVQTPGVSLPQPSGPTSITPAGYAANLTSRSDLNFEKTFSTRNQLMFTDGNDVKLIFTYAYQRTKTDGGQYNSAGVLGTGKYESAARYIEPVDRRAHLLSMEIDANIADVVDLVSTTAYTNVRSRTRGDNTDLLLDLDYDYELFPAFTSWNESDTKRNQINQEVRLVSRHGGPFSWVLGGFYNEQNLLREYTEHVPGLISRYGIYGLSIADNPNEIEYNSYNKSTLTEKAIFGEGTLKITPKWQVTAGARYYGYTSNVSGRAVIPLFGDPISPYDAPAAGGVSQQSGWVWKFNTSYNFTRDLLVYATYSKGYRIGGPNTVAPCPAVLNPPPAQNVCALPNEVDYKPDTTKNAEIGIRAQLFDRKLTLNFDVYRIDWDGVQVESATVNGIVGIIVNGGKARSEGFEASFQARPFDRLSIQGTYSYVDARLTQDVTKIIAVNSPAGTYPSIPIQLDALKGDRLPGSAKNSGSIGATYTMPFKGGNLIGNWTTTYRGNVVSRLGYDRAFGDLIPGYVLHRATLSYETDKFSISAFANNIFDKYAVVSVGQDRSRIGINDGVALRYYRQTVLTPRTFGIEARIKY